MHRWVQLIAGVLACTVGLTEVLTLTVALNLTYATSPAAAVSAQQKVAVVAVAYIGVGLGAYLHSVLRFIAGLILLWICTVLLIVGQAYVVLVPDALLSISPIFPVEFTGWAPFLTTLALVAAVIASLAPLTPSALPDAESRSSRTVPFFISLRRQEKSQ